MGDRIDADHAARAREEGVGCEKAGEGRGGVGPRGQVERGVRSGEGGRTGNGMRQKMAGSKEGLEGRQGCKEYQGQERGEVGGRGDLGEAGIRWGLGRGESRGGDRRCQKPPGESGPPGGPGGALWHTKEGAGQGKDGAGKRGMEQDSAVALPPCAGIVSEGK